MFTMYTYYIPWRGAPEIKSIEVVRRTEKSVWIETTRYTGETVQRRKSRDHYYDTFQDAKAAIENELEGRIDQAEQKIKYQEEHIKALEKQLSQAIYLQKG